MKVLKLCLYCGILFFFFAYAGPLLVSCFPTWQAFNQVQEDYNLHSGALYYSDVSTIKESEAAVRAGVAKGMELRRQQREQN